MKAAERERTFGIEELFFSTTDRKGIIQSGNRVFARVAAHEEGEMVGRPHSLIRHPDMPRCVFKLLWDTIEDGRAIAAYVKNRAKTGEPYWVMATIVPCEGGYLSVRLKPSSAYFDTVKTICPELRALELELGGAREVDRKQAMAASRERLDEILAAAGFPEYETFMHAALAAELARRAAQMSADAPPAVGSAGTPLELIGAGSRSITDFLDGMFGASLDGYVELTELNLQLATKSRFVMSLAESLGLFALNALIASTRLGSDGIVLGAVAGIMRGPSDSIRGLIRELSGEVDGAAAFLREIGFRVSVAKLQSQMVSVFVDELLAEQANHAEDADQCNLRTRDVKLLSGSLDEALRLLFAALAGLDLHLSRVADTVSQLGRDLKTIHALEVNGRIEAAHAPDAAAVVLLFGEISEQITIAQTELTEFADTAALGRATASSSTATTIRGDLELMHDSAAQLAAA
ncbi:MAG: hypothetical protein ACLP50_06280 [Solirubrobacteraceae bacterium]